MKKTKFFLLTLTAAVIVGLGFNPLYDEKAEGNLLLNNVEALANGESGSVKCCPDPGDQCTLSSGDVLQDQDEC